MAITFDVGFRADTKELSASLSTIQREVQAAFSAPTAGKGMSTEIAAAVKQAQILEQTLKKATTEKGTSFIQMNLELKKMGTSAEEMVATLAKAGPAFSGSLNTMLQTFATADRNLLSMSAKIKEMGRVLTQSFKFSAAQSAIQFVTGEAQEAIQWVQKLDSQLNTIQIVSGKTAAEMGKVYDVVIQKSKELRVAAQDYAEASQIFYQQGLGDEEVARRSEITIQAAKAAGQSTSDMADQLTAVWNTYQMQGDQLQRAASVGAKMGAETAVEFKDIAEAMQISASAASQMGVSYDSLAAIIATVGETTKQSASVIGNAYKTIFSRFYNLKAAGEEGAVELGQISNNLKQLGVDILDSSGELIELDNVIQNVGNSWDTYTQKQKIAIAEQVGGTRQYGQFLALMENFDKYQKNLASANAETGAETLLSQYETSLESIDSAMENASESWARAFADIFTSDAQIEFYHGVEKIGNVMENIMTTTGGLQGILTLIGAYLTRHIVTGAQRARDAAKEFVASLSVEKQLAYSQEKLDKMKQSIQQMTDLNMGFTPQSGAYGSLGHDTSTENTVEQQYLTTKLEITEQVTQANIRLQEIQRSGTAEMRNRVESERQLLETAQRVASTETDSLKAMRDQAKEQQRIASALNRRAQSTTDSNQKAALTDQAKQMQASIELVTSATQTSEGAVTKFKNNLFLMADAFRNADGDGASFAQSLQEVATGPMMTMDGTITDVVERMDEYLQRLRQEQIDNPTAARQDQINSLTQLRNNLDQTANSQQRLREAFGQVTDSSTRIKTMFDATGNSAKGMAKSLASSISNITMVTSVMGNMISGFQDGTMTISGFVSQAVILVPTIMSLASSCGPAIAGMLSLSMGLMKNTTEESANAAATILNKIAKEGLTVATLKQAAANTTLLASLGILAVAITAVVGVVMLLVAAWKEMKNQSPEHQLELAKEAAAGLEEEAKAAQETADNLRAAFDKYDSVVDKLQSCTRGTEEWKNALEEVNDAALGVINTLGDLSAEDIESLYSRNADGMIEFNEDKIAELQEKADQKASAAEYAASMGQVRVAQAKNDVALKDIGNAVFNEQYNNTAGNYAQASSTIQKIVEENLHDLSNLTETEFTDKLKELGIATSMLSDNAMKDLQTQVNALADSTEAADAKMKLIAQLKTDEVLGDDYDGEEKTIAANKMAAEEQKIYDELYSKYTGDYISKASGANNAIAKEMLEDYNEATGNNWSLDRNAVRGSDSNRTFAFLDESGELREFTAKQVASTIAASQALETLTGNAEAAAKTISKLERNTSDAETEAWKGFITEGNFNGLTEEEISSKLNEEDLTEWITDSYGLDPDADGFEEAWQSLAESLSYDSGAALVEGVREGLETSQKALNDVGSSLSDKAKEIFDTIDLSGVIVGGQQAVEDAFSQVYSNFGAEGAQKFAEAMSGVPDSFTDIMGQINWQDADVDSLKQQVELLGGSIEGVTDEQFATMIEMMQTMSEISFDAATASFKSVKDAVSGLENNTDTVSEEQMQALRDAGVAADAYFQKMADGTYQLQMDADAFAQLTHDIALKDMYDVAKTSSKKALDLAKVSSYTDEGMENSVYQQRRALEATGNLDAGQISDLNNTLSTEGYAAYAEQVKQAFQEANISAESIDNALTEAAAEAQAAKDAIADADFQFETESAGLDLDTTTRYAERLAKEMALTEKAAEGSGEEIEVTAEEIKKYEKAARDAAIRNQKLDRGLKSLNENLDDYKKKLKNSNKGSAEWSEAMDALKGDLADIVDFDDADLLSDQFAESALASEDLKLALDGDVDALLRLQAAAADDMMVNTIKAQADNGDLLMQQWDNVKSKWEEIKAKMADPATVGPVDQTKLIDSFDEMIANGNMTKDQIEAALAGMHVSANVKTEYVPQTVSVPQTITEEAMLKAGSATVQVPGEDGKWESQPVTLMKKVTRTYDAGTVDVQGVVPKYTIEGTTDEGGVKTGFVNAPAPKVSKGSTRSGGAGGGGGGSAPKHSAKKAAKYEPTQDRYGTIKAKIDKVERSLDYLSDATDKAFGAQAIRNMQKINKELQEQGHHYDELYKKAKQYHKIDLADMETERIRASKKLGIQLMKAETNDDGFVKNRTEIFEQINKRLKTAYDKYKNEADKFDKAKSTDENWSERIDDLKEEYETLKTAAEDYIGAIDQVDETANKMAEAIKDALDNLYTWMENKVEEANRKLELRVSINERDIEMVDFLLDKLGDTGLKQGKAWDGMKKNIKSTQNSLDGAVKSFERMQEILFNINDPNQQKWFENTFGSDIWKKYQESGGRLPQEVIDQMDDNADQMMDNLDTMFENADEMLHMYMEIFDLYLNEFDAIADKLSNNNDRLELFNELLEFSGQKYNPDAYGATKDLMDASISNAKTEVKRAKAVLDLSAQAAEETEKQLQSFYDDYGTDRDAWTTSQIFVHDRLLEARNEAQDALSDAQGDFTSAIKDLTDAASEAIEQMAEVIKMQVVDNLGGIFDSFDAMTEVYDQQYSLDHFFLEDYDKNYQLSDLLTQIDKQMENVTDPARLEEFKALIDEINAANEEGVQITQTDVDLLKAKFEMQKAQDAYEEAQAAKNTMRLVRDASGNWNYIYSTDAEDSSNAAEELANAQHNYEKLLHEARDEASELWMQAQQEFFEFQETIDWARYNQDEKYKQQIDYQYNYYMTTTERYTSQVAKYNDMLGDNFEDTSLGIITGFSSIEEAQKVYSEQHAAMNEQMNENTQEWGNVVKNTCIEMGIDYEDLEDVIREETSQMIDENQALEDKIDDLKNRASEDLTEMNNKVSGWRASFVSDMDQAIAKVKELIDWLQNLKKVQLGQMTYDKNTDYYDYLSSEYAASGLKGNKEEIKQWLKDNYEAEVYQRMGAYQDRFQGKEGYDYELATNPEKMLDVLAGAIHDAVVLGNADFWENDSWNYGSGTSGLQSKYPKKGKAASGGLISSRGVYELAENAPELVLNPADTRNILNAVHAMRDIVNAQIATAQGAMFGSLPQMAGKSEPTTVQQDVKIEASFPGVSVASEIEEAFNNLINQVAQYRIKK